jgi:hypothetical protein
MKNPFFSKKRGRHDMSKGNDKCGICGIEESIDELFPVIKCQHKYCKECLSKWVFNEASTCPECR